MHRIFAIGILFFFTICLYGQDTLNQKDAKGRKQGFWRKTDTAGLKIYEGFFRDGIPDGEFRYYYPDGKLKTLSMISNFGKKAITLSFYPNGTKMAEGNYVNEKKDSLWRFYSDINGLKVSEEFYLEGKINGKATVFFQDGSVSEVKNYRHGILDGLWEQYFNDGKLKLKASYLAGEKQGAYKTFYITGQLNLSGQYQNGHQDGTWTYLNEDGSLIKKEIYRNGRLLKTEEPAKK
jgi:antitoxin component YwqK of YwqJK toxin-antitoxin module